MTVESPQVRRILFGEHALDLERGALYGPAGELRLRPKSLDVLSHLALNAGRLVSRDELLETVWGRTIVTEDSLTQCLVEIRRVLGEAGRRVIRTVPRRGYLFDVPVEFVAGPGGGPAQETPEAPAAPRIRAAVPAGRAWPFAAWAVSVVAAVLVAAAVLDRPAGAPPPRLVAGDSRPSVAVLPFVDMSPDRDQAHFGEGVAEEILNLLAQSPGLKVIARTSSFSVGDKAIDVPAIGARLGVSHVLEGSVRRSGDRIRVTAQLIDARAGGHVWSHAYDRTLGEALDVQADIAAHVAQALHANLVAGGKPGMPDPRAYDHVLRGRFLFNRRAPGDLERAQENFQAAIELDPEYAPAWAGLAGALHVRTGEGSIPREVGLPAMVAAAERALALDPGLPEAHLRVAIARDQSGDEAGAAEHMRIAGQIAPDHPLLLALESGRALARGRLDEAIGLVRRAVDNDPVVPSNRLNLSVMLLAAGRVEEARREFSVAMELGAGRNESTDVMEADLLILEGRPAEALAFLDSRPASPATESRRGIAYCVMGRREDCDALAEGLRTGTSAGELLARAELHALRGEREKAVMALAESRAASLQDDPMSMPRRWSQLVHASPYLRDLRGTDGFQALLAQAD